MNRKSQIWRIIDLIQTTQQYLQQQNIENPRLNAELLLCHVLQLQRVDLYVQYDRPLTTEELNRYREVVKRRARREPLQYILGKSEFMSLPFFVESGVLIPRPETEVLVEWVVEDIQKEKSCKVLDLGTGSGNIAVSLAHYLPGTYIVAVDISRKALTVAKKNVACHNLESQIGLLVADFTSPRFFNTFKTDFDVIVSNPPYIPPDEFSKLQVEVRRFEPRSALYEGEKPGYFYDKIGAIAQKCLKPGGSLYVEIGYGRREIVERAISQHGFTGAAVRNDLAGIERVLRWKKLG